MTRISKNKLSKNLEKEALSEILKEIKKVDSLENLTNFLNGFFTAEEKKIILRRAAVIKLLKSGKKYREIKVMLEISRATISNVRDMIEGRGYGKNPNRKRKYSPGGFFPQKKKKPFSTLRYKGVSVW